MSYASAPPNPSITSKAFQIFKKNKSRVNVATTLNLNAEYVVTLFKEYVYLLNFDKLFTIYKELRNEIYLLDYLFFQSKQEGITTKDRISRFTAMAGRLTRLDEEKLKTCKEIVQLNSKVRIRERDRRRDK